MKVKDLIIGMRKDTGESQVEFAKRFKVTGNTVSRWETGTYEVPNWVIELLLNGKEKEVTCPKCSGRGKIWITSYDRV